MSQLYLASLWGPILTVGITGKYVKIRAREQNARGALKRIIIEIKAVWLDVKFQGLGEGNRKCNGAGPGFAKESGV